MLGEHLGRIHSKLRRHMPIIIADGHTALFCLFSMCLDIGGKAFIRLADRMQIDPVRARSSKPLMPAVPNSIVV